MLIDSDMQRGSQELTFLKVIWEEGTTEQELRFTAVAQRNIKKKSQCFISIRKGNYRWF